MSAVRIMQLASNKRATLLDRLRSAIDSISAERWAEAIAEPRLPCQHRAMSWGFLIDWRASLEAAVGREVAQTLNSYQIVGDKNLSGEWQGDGGRDWTACLPWCVRHIAARSSSLSLVETIVLAAELSGDSGLLADSSGRPYFGTTTIFVSYSWAASFSNLLAALDAAGAASAGFMWVDIFAVGQCRHTAHASECNVDDVGAFESVIGTAEATYLWSRPWHDPVTFHRVWCLFEALKTVDLGKQLQLIMSPDEADGLRNALTTRFDDILQVISSVDAAKADATCPSDKELIFSMIEDRAGGMLAFNADLISALRRWLLEESQASLERLRATHGVDLEVARLESGVASLLQLLGRFEAAEVHFRRVLACYEVLLPSQEHPSMAEALYHLAWILQLRGQLDDAEPLARRALSIRVACFGDDDALVARSRNNLASVLFDLERYAEAEPIFRQALASKEAALGPDHPSVATTLSSLGRLLQRLGDYTGAEVALRRALEIREKLGPEHLLVAKSLYNLGRLLQDRGELGAASDLLKRSFNIRLARF